MGHPFGGIGASMLRHGHQLDWSSKEHGPLLIGLVVTVLVFAFCVTIALVMEPDVVPKAKAKLRRQLTAAEHNV